MSGLESRNQETDPRAGKFHVVKAGNNVPNFSYFITWADMVAAMGEDNPTVTLIASTVTNLPADAPVGTPAYVQDESALYIFDTDEAWKTTQGAGFNNQKFERTAVADGENNIDVGFTLKTQSLVIRGGVALHSSTYGGVGTSILILDTALLENDEIIVLKN